MTGSPLIDAIPTGHCDPNLPQDQRGVTRPQGPGCDIGATEAPYTPPPPGPAVTPGTAVTPAVTPAGSCTATRPRRRR
ncbi:MAG: hypothetical protein M5U14_08885 [Acidimicrobiia bacterium]|nr:hypothetical protein [Acidimicrobiia bacterium]